MIRSASALRRGLRRAMAALQPSRGYAAKQILVAPQDLRISDPTTAAAILSGELLFAGRFVRSEAELPFSAPSPGVEFTRKLHSFGWLRHFRGLPADVGPVEARRLIAGWMKLKPMPAAAHDSEPAARRVIAFISHSPLVLNGADSGFYAAYLGAISADVARLRGFLRTAEAGERLTPSVALVYAALGCKGLEPLIGPACDALVEAIGETILPDGAHRSRNPARTIDLCFDLLPLRQALGIRERAMSKPLSDALSAMLRMQRTLCHRDRRLVTFNGAGPAIVSDLAILHAYDRAEALHSPSTGDSRYLRLDAGQTTVFLDGGVPPDQAFSGEHHFAPLALEWSHFDRRIVISCGAPPQGLPELTEIARRTAAHSTLEIDGEDAAVAAEQPGGPIIRGAKSVEVARLASPGWTLIDSSHDGYRRAFGVDHHRKIALSEEGTVIAGEDRLIAHGRSRARPPAFLRFHLAPDVQASLSSSGQGVALDAGSAGVWLFSVEGRRVALEESVVFATFRGRQRTAQIVVAVPEDGAPVIWRFTKMRDSSA